MAGMALGQQGLMGGVLKIFADLKMPPGFAVMPGRLVVVTRGGQMMIRRRGTICHGSIRSQ